MTFDVDINGRARRIEIERQRDGFLVSVDGRRQVADVTVVGGLWSLILMEAPDAGDAPDKAGAGAGADENHARCGFGRNEVVGSGFTRNGTCRSYEIAIVEQAGSSNLTVHVNGRVVAASVSADRGSWARRGHEVAVDARGPQRISSPMAGRVVKVLVKPGDEIAARQGVVVVEAMKMENELRSSKAGTVTDVRVTEGSSVEAGAILVIIE